MNTTRIIASISNSADQKSIPLSNNEINQSEEKAPLSTNIELEQLIKNINAFMYVFNPQSCEQNQEQETSLIKLQSDFLLDEMDENTKYFIGRFKIDGADLQEKINLERRYVDPFFFNDLRGHLDDVKARIDHVIKTYISEKIGISPIELKESRNKSFVQVFVSGQVVNDYISQCELRTNDSPKMKL